jgi:hypothetical protein
MKHVELALSAHCGNVSAPQRILIQRIASDLLKLELLDERAADGTISEHECRIAHALRNSVRLSLREIGLDAAGKPVSSAVDQALIDAIVKTRRP